MKILIVDDEKLIRNWLTMLLRQIPDKNIEISDVSNVDEALAYCQQNEVHLVITDITMPQRTGLELLELLRKMRPEICTAVLSAYDDYQYVRTAMQLGAIDYILKAEMQLSDLISVIKKVELFSNNNLSAIVPRGTLSKNNDYNLADFLDDATSLATFLADVNPCLNMSNFIVYGFSLNDNHNVRPKQVLDVCNKTLASENLIGSTFQTQNVFWMICNSEHTILEHQKEALQRFSLLLERNLLTVLHRNMQEEASFSATDTEELRRALESCLISVRCRQYYPTTSSSTAFIPLNKELLQGTIKKLRFYLDLHRYSDAADHLLEAIKVFHQKKVNPEDLKPAIHHCLTIIFLNTSEVKGNIVFASHYQNINRQLNLANTEESVTTLVREICALFKNELKSTKKTLLNPSLKNAIAYIDQNYMNRITLEDVAQHIYLNKSYISQMFMKHLGISFVSYVESVRIYKAQELLQSTDMSVTDIAEKTGYASQSYFTKAFKKRVGMAPLQYRLVSVSDTNPL